MDIKTKIKTLLIKFARDKKTLTYGEVVKAVDPEKNIIDTGINNKAQVLYKILTDLSEESYNENGIFLSVIVISQRKKKPGWGFIKFVRDKIGKFHWKYELEKLYDFYSKETQNIEAKEVSKPIKNINKDISVKKILGIDVGFSLTRPTSAFCILEIKDQKIDFISKPTKFVFPDFKKIFTEKVLEHIDIITIDAPLTTQKIPIMPKTGRFIDRLFSCGLFHNSRRGPQPGSISTPAQGWPLYEAGMVFKEYFSENGFNYFDLSKEDFSKDKKVLEIIPKLTQTLTANYDHYMKRPRKSQIDNYLFPHTFKIDSRFLKGFEGYQISNKIFNEIKLYNTNTKYYHEELAGLIAAMQGALFSLNNYSNIGFAGDNQGHYLLPNIKYWDPVWQKQFEKSCKKHPSVITV